MKAVRAYTYQFPLEDKTRLMIVTDDDKHIPVPIWAEIHKHQEIPDNCADADKGWTETLVNIQPVELPDKEEV